MTDHLQTLHQSLAHYERMLSHSHPAYLSQSKLSLAQARGGTDNALLLLTLVSVMVLAMQCVIGLFSINVGRIPTNRHKDKDKDKDDPPGFVSRYNVFYIIVAISILLGFGTVGLTRWWWLQAKKKNPRNMSRG
ncbi:hypothetical protein M422DRAFT_272816 [Sphaerobolus stellatus SS14]|uniref:Unplaced genomic scaffold SPHSTscaffold_307, whole genome shotgun sequence n=1 Tax=Sphaerobolus stellatus (strain SS14) TaxID=990650 RepID=A0A0C9TAJ3_SPHS4|nr:hypothetical protein M422DRAFT_272816 [Sphaerobolus stellatus SS14]